MPATPAEFYGSVLLLEDNLLIAMGMSAEIEGLGFDEVVIAATNQEALSYLQNGQPRIAVLDVKLENSTSSAETAKALQDRKIPFVFVSGMGTPESMKVKFPDARSAIKPLTGESLREELEALSSRS